MTKPALKAVLPHLGIGPLSSPPVVRHSIDRSHDAGAVAAAMTVYKYRLVPRVVNYLQELFGFVA